MCFSKLVRHRLCFVVRAAAMTSTISLGVIIAQASVEPEQRIRHIQDAILPAVFTKGEPPATTKLADRMAALHVPGVSIAVVHDGKIEWVRVRRNPRWRSRGDPGYVVPGGVDQ